MAFTINYTVKPTDTLTGIWKEQELISLGYTNWQELYYANEEEILKVGRDRMAASGIGIHVNSPRGACGLTPTIEHEGRPHFIKNGIHYDETYMGIDIPTIYPYTVLRLKSNPALDEKKDDEDQQEDSSENEKNEIGADEDWEERVTCQTPGPMLQIFRPPYEKEEPDITYSPKIGDYNKLLGYNFTEGVDDLHGSFSFMVEDEENDEDSVFDKIPLRSIVKIYEGDPEKPVFVGIVRRRKIGVAMTQNVKRTITFSGKSLASCVAEYMISLDIRIHGVMSADGKTQALTIELMQENLSIKDFVKITWKHFNMVAERIKEAPEGTQRGVTNAGIKDIIVKFMCDAEEIEVETDDNKKIKIPDTDKFVTVEGKETTIYYNIACSFYNQANNVISDMWRNILPDRVYEMYAYCRDGRQKIMVRQVPYGDGIDNDDWKNLPIYLIRPIALTSYNLEQTDEEVYTVYVSYLEGSVLSRNQYMAMYNSDDKGDDIMMKDPEKMNIYGFKPLQLDFIGYDKQGNTDTNKQDNIKDKFRTLNKKAAYWYSRLDDMYSGSITLVNNFNKPHLNPRVGCRAKFMGAEFYITKTEHSWQYGGTPIINLTLARGMIYDKDGIMQSGEEGIIKKVGSRYREFVREVVK